MGEPVEVSLEHLSLMCSTIEGLLVKGFGPNSLQTLLSTSTGKMAVTSDGLLILSAMNFSHPVGKTILSSIKSFHSITGDGSKTFAFIINSLFRQIQDVCKSEEDSGYHKNDIRIKLSRGFADFACVEIPRLVAVLVGRSRRVCLVEGSYPRVREVGEGVCRGVLAGRVPAVTGDHLARVVTDLVLPSPGSVPGCAARIRAHIASLGDTCLETHGAHPRDSAVIPGVVIQREFLYLPPGGLEGSPVRLALLGTALHGEEEEEGVTIRADSEAVLRAARGGVGRAWRVLSLLAGRGVRCLVSGPRVTDPVLEGCRARGMAVLHAVCEEDLQRLAWECRVHVIHHPAQAGEEGVVARVAEVKPAVIGNHRVVHIIGFPSTDSKSVPFLHTGTGNTDTGTPIQTGNTGRISGNTETDVNTGNTDTSDRDTQDQDGNTQTDTIDTGTTQICYIDTDGSITDTRDSKEEFSLRQEQPRQLHICGASPGAVLQIRVAVLNALKSLLMLLDTEGILGNIPDTEGMLGNTPDTEGMLGNTRDTEGILGNTCDTEGMLGNTCDTCSNHGHAVFTRGGGYIETLLHHTLSKHTPRTPDVTHLLSHSFLSVPRTLLRNSNAGKHSASFQAELLSLLQTKEAFSLDGRTGKVSDESAEICEPIASKVLLLYHVCEVMKQLLRLDKLVSVTRINPQNDNDEDDE